MGAHRARRRVLTISRAGRGVLTAAAALAVTGGAAGAALAGQVPTGPAINDDYHEPHADAAGRGAMSADTEGRSGGELQGATHTSTAGSGAEIHSEMQTTRDADGGPAAAGEMHATPAGTAQGTMSVDPEGRSGGQLQGATDTTTAGSGAEIHSEMPNSEDADAAEIERLVGELRGAW